MTTILGLIISVIGVLFIPLLLMIWRGAQKWTRVEVKLDNAISRLDDIVESKDKVHQALYEQMKSDREATNQRLTYLERLWIEMRIK